MSHKYKADDVTRKPRHDARIAIKEKLDEVDLKCPSILYHYTSLDKLEKITNSKCLMGSKIAHLNDPKERRYGQDLIAKALQYRRDQSQGGVRAFFEKCFRGVCIGEKWSQDYETSYSISLSASSRIKKMWRMYGDNRQGIAIGFRADLLTRFAKSSFAANPTKQTGNKPIKMFYMESQHNETVDAVLRLALHQFTPLVEGTHPSEEVLEDITHFTTNALFATCCRFKTEKWAYEQEWRIGPSPWHDEDDLANLLTKNVTFFGIRPKLPLSLATDASDAPMGIAEIVLGPEVYEAEVQKRITYCFKDFPNMPVIKRLDGCLRDNP